MNALLALARLIDALTERVGRVVIWLVLVATLISAGNALTRYLLGASSNAWLEIQWYLFGAMFLLAAGYTLKHNGHVRIDIFYNRLGARGQAWIDLIGGLLFLLPMLVGFTTGVTTPTVAITYPFLIAFIGTGPDAKMGLETLAFSGLLFGRCQSIGHRPGGFVKR